MARTAFVAKKTPNKPPASKRTTKKVGDAPLVLQSVNTARKKSLSVKTPKIIQPPKSKISEKTRPRRDTVTEEIRYFQKSTNFLMNKSPFIRMVKSLVFNIISKDSKEMVRFKARALSLLQEAFEAYVVSLLEDGSYCATHAKRVTLFDRDLELVKKLTSNRRYY
jgi:histone H3